MRVMVVVKSCKESEAGILPSSEILAKMGKYNEELQKAGILLAAEGLRSSAKGKRVKFGDGKRIVTDGPFAETKEFLAGYYLVDCPDLGAPALETQANPGHEGVSGRHHDRR